ncbi:hypothetical protein PMAYCL1PPCAC_02289, partial [Pristionchus mayeri]
WEEVRVRVAKRFKLEMDAETHWELALSKMNLTPVITLSSECVSTATTHLHNLKLIPWPPNYRQQILQCSDRYLDDCQMYHPESGLDWDGLNAMEGVSIEMIAPSHLASHFDGLSKKTALLDTVVVESTSRNCPLYLFPRRSYDRLTRDLFDGGILICSDYHEIEVHSHPYDNIELPLITDTTRRSSLERRLRAESSLLEYGSFEWMEWFARRLRYWDYHPETLLFYHRIIAERDLCVHDEILIQRIQSSLLDSHLGKAKANIEKLRVDAFIYSTMDIIQRGERLLSISPPSSSFSAIDQLTHFIRSRRMPPLL